MVTLPTESFDLVVLGSGPGGEKGAAQAAYFGRKVALVERAPEVGGACVHTGTLPSKTLRETALYLTGFRRRQLYGMSVRLDRKKSLRQLVGRLREVTDLQTRQIGRNLNRHGIVLVSGAAAFEDPSTVTVMDAEGQVTRRLSAGVFLIATGSSPMPPRGIEITDPDVVDSDRILDLDRVPTTMTVVGGGVIGTEYACLFAALGTRITLVEGRDRLLGGTDEELSSTLQLSLERMGAEILLGDAVQSIERLPDVKTNALSLTLKSGRMLRADKVLFSAGRAGNTGGLNLDKIGVNVTERGHIAVNEHFQTSVPHIYAVGDVIGFPALASVSMEQGRVAVCHAFQIAYKTTVSPVLPYGIYSVPEISSVGPSEQELKEKGIEYEVGRARFENNARGQITGDSDGVVKLLFDPKTRKLLAAHILGEDATELIHIPMFLIAGGGTIDAFIDAVFNFPTLAEAFKYAAYDGLQRLAQRDRGVAAPGRAPEKRRPRPAARPWFIGLALSGRRPTPGQPISVCVMDRWRRCRFKTWSYAADASGLLSEEAEREGFVLSVGAEGSAGEALLAGLRPNFRIFPEAAEWADVVPTHPAALWKAWGLATRGRRAGVPSVQRRQYEILRSQGLELPLAAESIHHDQLDAAAAGYTAYLWATGQAREQAGAVIPA
ncbi:MAG TPA: Si-specific NAD(P)(+) transhydrogenase [Thermoanaerobaculia bacterium]|jgi:NAD(P) transhydrogenase|nr:Si-specific NAD(P)(+) transhydrogenase [Thermoanaerobaculia bacterium]